MTEPLRSPSRPRGGSAIGFALVLIVMADQLGKSVGDMYEGAFIPGLSLAALYAAVRHRDQPPSGA